MLESIKNEIFLEKEDLLDVIFSKNNNRKNNMRLR